MSIHNLGAAGGPSGRYYTSLGSEDYYTQGGEPEGRWRGRSAATLGLLTSATVKTKHLQAILEGRSLVDTPLVAGAGPERRGGWDCTFSAPKSVSLAWALETTAQQARISAAQQYAVTKALSHLERHAAFARRGHAGKYEEVADGLVVATFEHSTSRALDPQLHTHALIANLAQRTDGSWGGIESRHLYEWKMAAGAIYRAALAKDLRRMGYQIETDKDSFRIVGIPQSAERAFSKRRNAIEHEAVKRGLQTSKGLEMLALETRERKPAINRKDLFRNWVQQATELGLTQEKVHELVRRDRAQGRSEIAHSSIDDILHELTSKTSVFRATEIWRTVAVRAIAADWDYQRMSDCVSEIEQSADLVRLTDSRGQGIYSTREMVQLEQDMAYRAKILNRDGRHAISARSINDTISRNTFLNNEQMTAVRHVCSSGSVTAISGLAGTGKSTAAGVIREAYEQNGYTVIGAALSGKAADGLERGAKIPSYTLHALLHNLDRQRLRLNDRHVIVLDEASMVGSRQMSALLSHVESAHTKLVLIGDEKQLQAVEAGGAFRAITQRIGAAQLVDIRRQKEGWTREAVRQLAKGDAVSALASFRERNLIKVSSDRDAAIRNIVEDWLTGRKADHPEQDLILAGTREDVNQINCCARALLGERGELGLSRRDNQGREWAVGDRVVFLRNSRLYAVRNGQLGTILETGSGFHGLELNIRLDSGDVLTIAEDYPHLDYGYAISVHKAQGVTVERAHVLLHESMSNREWSYVASSRARDRTTLHCEANMYSDLEKKMGRVQEKETTLDYQQAPAETSVLGQKPDIQVTLELEKD